VGVRATRPGQTGPTLHAQPRAEQAGEPGLGPADAAVGARKDCLASPAGEPSSIAEPSQINTVEVRERADQNEECKDDERRQANLTSLPGRSFSY